jgi:hypothetical protein
VAEKLAEVGPHLAVYRVKPDDLIEQDVNAHVMAPEMFERLTENIKTEGRLESLPLTVARPNGKFEIVSGHHRVRAARTAELKEFFVLADTRDLSRSKVVAKQLAHNSIFGKDDKQTLKKLYEELDNVDDILQSYLRPEDFDDVKQLEPAQITDISVAIPWKHLTLVFVPRAMAALERIDGWVKRIPKETDTIGVVGFEILDRFRTAALAVGRTEDVRSLGAIITRMTEIVEIFLEEHNSEQSTNTDHTTTSPADANPAAA